MLHEHWELDGSVALRPEPFGALLYDFRTRRLSFLKSPALVALVTGLAAAPTVADALEAAGLAPADRQAHLRALDRLAATGMLTRGQAA